MGPESVLTLELSVSGRGTLAYSMYRDAGARFCLKDTMPMCSRSWAFLSKTGFEDGQELRAPQLVANRLVHLRQRQVAVAVGVEAAEERPPPISSCLGDCERVGVSNEFVGWGS